MPYAKLIVFTPAEIAHEHEPQLKLPFPTEPCAKLVESLQRLDKMAVVIAVFNDGSFQVIHAAAYGQPANEAFTVWSPMDMFFYLLLPPSERAVFRQFKKLGGTMEWVPKSGAYAAKM